MLNSRKTWWRVLVLSAGASLILAALVATPVVRARPDRLENHSDWLCSKEWLSSGMMGSEGIKTGSDAIAGGYINLGSWMGFHELLFARQLVPQTIAFRFRLARGATITCVFNKGPDAFEGIRFSANPDNPGAYLLAADTGEFLEKRPLDSSRLVEEGRWHDCRLSFTERAVEVEMDGRTEAVPRVSANQPGWVGFRSGYGDTLVDDIAILEKGRSRPHTESFRKRTPLLGLAGTILASAAYVFLPMLATFGVLNTQWRRRTKRFLAAYAFFMTGMTAAFLFVLLSMLEPPTMQELKQEVRGSQTTFSLHQLTAARERQAEFAKRYIEQPLTSKTRIVFLGTSQTWGAGARRDPESFVALLQSLLDADTAPEHRIECLNGAIQGSIARLLFKAYSETYIQTQPALTVVNLSCNDYWEGTPDFADALRDIVRINQAAGIKTLFVLEATSPDVFPDGLPTYAAMSQVASEMGVPLVNAHQYLKDRRDEGFLFWDRVHPTSYGHRLLAECLFPVIAELAGMDATRHEVSVSPRVPGHEEARDTCPIGFSELEQAPDMPAGPRP